MKELLQELNKVYGKKPVKLDVFGKRQALPTEVARVLNLSDSFIELVDLYPPSEEDLEDKKVKT